MPEIFKYSLQKYSGPPSRHTCPSCSKSKVFVRYVDNETGDFLGDQVGRCNREIECGYHYKPSEYLSDNPLERNNASASKHKAQLSVQKSSHSMTAPSYLPSEYLEMSVDPKLQNGNNLITYLQTVLGTVTDRFVKRFMIGTAKRWPGATVFWYVDHKGNVRSGKVMLYNSITGKRIKEPYNHIDWVHSILERNGSLTNFNFKMCLFGEHQLLTDPRKPIGIVESEKTAVIASAYLPTLTWMASGSLNAINAERFAPIKQNDIILYPDIKGYDAWQRKAKELSENGFRITVSDLLEKGQFVTAEDRTRGLDLADYLPRLPLPKTPLERLQAKNPLVRELINRIGLIDISK